MVWPWITCVRANKVRLIPHSTQNALYRMKKLKMSPYNDQLKYNILKTGMSLDVKAGLKGLFFAENEVLNVHSSNF